MNNENDNNLQSKNKANPQERNAHQSFQVQNKLKGIFPMFYEISDPYIYDKKFYCDLPQVITPTKSFHYPFSIDSFCQFDLLTMTFDLKKNCELLTDPKLNTLIHQDFINNSLELIFPNLTQATHNSKTEQLKKDILEIVERQEDVPSEKKTAMHNRSFYLRNSTYFRTSLNVKSENEVILAAKKRNKALSDNANHLSTDEAKKIIGKTFTDISSLNVGNEHPHKPGVTAKNVYDVLPYSNLGGNDFCQFIFPIDPNQETKANEKFEKPEKYILKKKKNDDVYSLYLNDHLKSFNDKKDNNTAEYYSYDKDYTSSAAHQYDLFNRFLIFVNKETKKARFASIANKITLKKFKKPAVRKTDAEEAETDNMLKIKRERDIIVVPKEIEENGVFKRNQWLKQNGFLFEFVGQTIPDIDYTEVEEIQKEKNLEQIQMYNSDEEIQAKPKKERNEEEDEYDEEDYFGLANDEEASSNNRRSDAQSKSNYSNDENAGSERINKDQEDDDEDALFSEKEENYSDKGQKKDVKRLIRDDDDED